MSEAVLMDWITDEESFVEFISYILLSAPNDFPREDYLRDDEQMTLDTAFDELRSGLRYIAARVDDSDLTKLKNVLNESHEAYRDGETRKGAHLLQEFRQRVLTRT